MPLDLGNIRKTNKLLVEALEVGPYGPGATDVFDLAIRSEMIRYSQICGQILNQAIRIMTPDLKDLRARLNRHDHHLGRLLDSRIAALRSKPGSFN